MYNDGTGMDGGGRQGLLTSHLRRSGWCKLAPYWSPASLPRQEVTDSHTSSYILIHHTYSLNWNLSQTRCCQFKTHYTNPLENPCDFMVQVQDIAYDILGLFRVAGGDE